MEVYSAKIENIKSPYILRKLLSLLWENKKLDLIIYNKQLQNKLFINLENYKNASNKYKIVGTDGKGKEYIMNTNILIFEGEYLNGKRNGKGKEYNINGNLLFEGEYLNGKKVSGIGYDKKKYNIDTKRW